MALLPRRSGSVYTAEGLIGELQHTSIAHIWSAFSEAINDTTWRIRVKYKTVSAGVQILLLSAPRGDKRASRSDDLDADKQLCAHYENIFPSLKEKTAFSQPRLLSIDVFSMQRNSRSRLPCACSHVLPELLVWLMFKNYLAMAPSCGESEWQTKMQVWYTWSKSLLQD